MKQMKFKVGKMVDDRCEIKICNAVKVYPGVHRVRADFKTRTVLIALEDEKITEDQMKEVIESLGYKILRG